MGKKMIQKRKIIYLASFALRHPKWYSVALFFWVLEISFSISAILSRIPILGPGGGGPLQYIESDVFV